MDAIISSLQNNRVKELVRLRTRQGRQQQHRFTIDGIREIERAQQAKYTFLETYFCDARCSSSDHTLIATLTKQGAAAIEVTSSIMDKIAYGQRTLALIAVVEIPNSVELTALEVTQSEVVFVLEGIENPGNLGAIARTADAAGVSAIILADSECDACNPNAIRSSAGAIFHLPVVHDTTLQIQKWLQIHHFDTFATRVDGSCCYSEVSLTGRAAIVLGTEATGLTDLWNSTNSQAISVPMCGVGDSLNVSTTAAILAYESQRQRHVQTQS
ncbi:MAG: RNA methyltransferase [Planctomycetaceae bacterium]|jgi:RNA methyltransferase, TrmH family|nr:RNA methyltransferase [Planctomycetaceae bacterium]